MKTAPELDEGTRVRQEAIDRYLKGEPINQIYPALGRSRSWFYATLKRYRRGGRAGLCSQSRAPHHVHNRTPEPVATAIVRIRKTIESGEDPELRYADLGAASIAKELERLGHTPPHAATIYRVLHRRDALTPRPRKASAPQLPGDYPRPHAGEPNAIHQVDFVQRTLVGGQRVYGCHLLDIARRWPFLRVLTAKTTDTVGQFFVAAWQEVGLPTAIQIDNDVVWNGGGRGTRVLGKLVRLCLAVGVQVIFVPPYTPKANGHIESFNDLWDSNFWQRTQFHDAAHMRTELPYFETYCRQRRPIPDFDTQTPAQRFPEFQPTVLPADFALHQQPRLPITAGYVHFIRFVTPQDTFSILNETWSLEAHVWRGTTIRATVDTATQQLRVYHHPPRTDHCCLIAQFDYPLAESAVALDPTYVYQKPTIWRPVKEPDE